MSDLESSESEQEESSGGAIRSVVRATSVVQEVSDAGPEGLRLIDIVVRTGLSKTTVHRLLSTLVSVGWVELDDETGTYYLGIPMVGFGITASDRHGLLELARPNLQGLADLTEDTAYLSVPLAGRALCLDQARGTFPVRLLSPTVGDRTPMGSCAGSLALLAGMSDADIEEILGRERHIAGMDHRIPEAAVLQEMIAETRTRGYALYPGLLIPDTVGVGVPVRGVDGIPVAALSVATIQSRMTETRRVHVVGWLLREAQALEATLLQMNPRFKQDDVRRLLGAEGH